MGKQNKKIILLLLLTASFFIFLPIFALTGAKFGGTDDAGSAMIAEIDHEYKPWFTPILETWIQGELPSEIESLLFCLQTGIGVAIVAFTLGRMVERKKWQDRK